MKKQKILTGIGLLLTLAGKPVVAQNTSRSNSTQNTKEKTQKQKQITQNNDTISFEDARKNKFNIAKLHNPENWIGGEIQLFACNTPKGPGFVGAYKADIKPSVDLFNSNVNVGWNSTMMLTGSIAKNMPSTINDCYAHATVKIDNKHSIEAQYGCFRINDCTKDASMHTPAGFEYFNLHALNSSWFLPMATTITFHFDNNNDIAPYIGAGLSSSRLLKWDGDRKFIILSGYKLYSNTDTDFWANFGMVLTYNTGTFGQEYQFGKDMLEVLQKLEWGGFVSGNLGRIYLSFSDRINNAKTSVIQTSLAYTMPKTRLSCDLYWALNEKEYPYIDSNGETGNISIIDPYDFGGQVSFWYTPIGAYVSVGYGRRPDSVSEYFTNPVKPSVSVEAGIRSQVSKLFQNCRQR